MALIYCARCSAGFDCGIGRGSCWCMELSPMLPVPTTASRCFCPGCLTMNQHIKTYPPVTVAYFRSVGPYGVDMKAVWEQLNHWAKTRSLCSPSGIMYGISHDSPMDTPPDKCRYDACFEVPSTVEIDGGAQRADLPGGDYAVLPFRGLPVDIVKGFDRVFHQIIPETGKQFDPSRPVFERYDGDCRVSAGGTFGCDLCVPVK